MDAPLRGDPFTLEHFSAWCFRLTLDNGKHFRLVPYQEEFAADLLEGRPENWLIVPEGNGKSTFIAALGLYHCAYMPDAFVPVAAAAKDQARIIYRQAAGFVRRGGAWGFRPYDGTRKISHKAQGSELEVFSADERTGDGIIPTLCFLDELHRHKNLGLYETWRGKLGKRKGLYPDSDRVFHPQLVTISTAGEPGSEFEEARDRIRQSGGAERDGSFTKVKTPRLLMHEWAVPVDDDVEDMDAVKRANPLPTITVESLREKYTTPTMTMPHWKRFTCNQPARSEFAAISEKEWFDAEVKNEIPEGEPVAVGIDLGWKWDTTAIVPLWLRDQHFRLFGRPKILVPPRDGTATPGWKVEQALLELHERNPIRMVVMDMSAGGVPVAEWIDQNIKPDEIIDRGQQNKDAAEDYHAFTDALREGWLKHSGDAEMTRHVLNAIARVLPQGDARFERPVQTRNSSEQDRRVIDALVAAAMVHCVAAQRWGTGDAVFDWQAVAPA